MQSIRQVAFVTGATYGVGAATALALARDGFDVAVSATQIGNLSDITAQLDALGARCFAIGLQLQSLESIKAAVSDVIGAFGRVDLLVNNAAANISCRAVDVTPEQWDMVIRTNVTGTFFITQEVGRRMIESGRGGSIVNITSTNGLIGTANRSTYGISKAAVIHMTKTLAVEWAAHGIRVNSIAPGRLITPSPSRQATANNPNYLKNMLDQIPLHRFATVEEVAAAVCYLAGPSASSVTGQTLVLDGGLTSA